MKKNQYNFPSILVWYFPPCFVRSQPGCTDAWLPAVLLGVHPGPPVQGKKEHSKALQYHTMTHKHPIPILYTIHCTHQELIFENNKTFTYETRI